MDGCYKKNVESFFGNLDIKLIIQVTNKIIEYYLYFYFIFSVDIILIPVFFYHTS